MAVPELTIYTLEPAEPLRKRAPTSDEHGNSLSDFMVLFKGLRDKPRQQLQQTVDDIQMVLAQFSEVVTFADLNLKLNLLWVSIRPVGNSRHQIADALRRHYPDARLVSHI